MNAWCDIFSKSVVPTIVDTRKDTEFRLTNALHRSTNRFEMTMHCHYFSVFSSGLVDNFVPRDGLDPLAVWLGHLNSILLQPIPLSKLQINANTVRKGLKEKIELDERFSVSNKNSHWRERLWQISRHIGRHSSSTPISFSYPCRIPRTNAPANSKKEKAIQFHTEQYAQR